MRGERTVHRIADGVVYGSSPHARGTLRERLQVARRARFIPACAGNATVTLTACCAAAVHPRMRGER